MELFQERGYARTTVSDIAERAGLTERTFFRYFVDKREVLFSYSKELEDSIVNGVKNAPKTAAPLDVVASVFEAAGAALQANRDMAYVRARHAIVVAHSEVRERELIKLASLATAVTKALHARGVAEPTASLVAETGISVFKIGFEGWVTAKNPGELARHIRAAVNTLRAITGKTASTTRVRKKRTLRA
jgi:AcrR family transcriptional regulator